jgi:hypothetical protein
MKKANVILAFHAHEPLWDLPNELIALIDDREIHDSIRSENYILNRAKQGRDIYAHLIQTAELLGAPVTLDATNELLVQLAWYAPESFQNLAAGYKNGTIYPVYTNAHHTHAALLTPDELSDELRLNSELLHAVMGVAEPKHKGAFPTECSIDASLLSAYKDSGMEFIIFPHINRRKTHYSVDNKKGDLQQFPFLIGPDLIALPRNFPVSQYIWKPITRYDPVGVKNQGYILGQYWVFEEEYRNQSFISYPISWQEAISEYSIVLEKALRALPDDGLILYIQDLELMDFGDVALQLLEQAWKTVIDKKIARVHFVTPDDYIDKLNSKNKLPRVSFYQSSWAPEIRPVLRYDGHYPPLDAGDYKSINLTTTVFKHLPFVFWEPGRFLVKIYGSIIDAFGIPRRISIDAPTLHNTRYAIPRFSFHDKVALHYRLIKRACNWGWRPDEGRQKRPFLHGYCLSELLLGTDSRDIAFAATRYIHPGDAMYLGAEQILELLIDNRLEYLRIGIEEKDLARGEEESALLELQRAQSHRSIAIEFIQRASQASKSVVSASSPESKNENFQNLARELKGYCREVFVATDHIQRAWGYIQDTESMILIMYQYLYELYPPKFPAVYKELFPEQWKDRQNPKLH